MERRTGIEGWFDEPLTTEVDGGAGSTAPTAPPRWKQAVMIWLAFFPLSLVAAYVLKELAPTISVLPRVLLTTVVMTPLMTYVVLPA